MIKPLKRIGFMSISGLLIPVGIGLIMESAILLGSVCIIGSTIEYIFTGNNKRCDDIMVIVSHRCSNLINLCMEFIESLNPT